MVDLFVHSSERQLKKNDAEMFYANVPFWIMYIILLGYLIFWCLSFRII